MNDWDHFYHWLNPDKDRAASEYKGLRVLLIAYFKGRSCHDYERLADDTIERVVQILPKFGDDLPDNPPRFCFGVAKYIFKEYKRKEGKWNGEDPANLSYNPNDPAQAEDKETMDKCLYMCLQKLDRKKREMFISYYLIDSQDKSIYHQKMADQMGITITALRLQILRIKEKLRICIKECMSGGGNNFKF